MGKTSLLRAACQSASEMGFICLRARATELERDFAYGCARQLLEPVVANATVAERDRMFDGAAALSKPLFAPSGVELSSQSADRSFSVLHGLYWLLNNLADGAPIVLAVDDLQWSDTESLRFLNYLTPRLDGLRLVVLATSRSGERSTDLTRLAASPEATVLRPAPLSTEATATLCARLSGGQRRTRLRRRLPRRDRWQPVLPRGTAARGSGPAAVDQLRRSRPGAAHRTRRGDRSGPPPPVRCPSHRGRARAGGRGDRRRRQRRRGSRDGRARRGGGSWRRRPAGRPRHPPARGTPRVRPSDRARSRARGHRSTRARRRPRPGGPDPGDNAVPRRNGSPPRSSRPRRPVMRGESSSCGASPGRRSSAEHPPPPSPGSDARWRSRRRPRSGRSC